MILIVFSSLQGSRGGSNESNQHETARFQVPNPPLADVVGSGLKPAEP